VVFKQITPLDKVEIVRIEHPDNLYKALDGMVDHIKSILDELKLPYRVLRLCGGDMGFASALTYDSKFSRQLKIAG
jgi:seryl-tRNA synthetase